MTGGGSASRSRYAAPERPRSWGDELRNALAFAGLAGVYALMIGALLHMVRSAALTTFLGAFALAYALAVAVFAGANALGWVLLRLVAPVRRSALLPLAGPLASLIACAVALPRLFRAVDLAELLGTAAFLGAALALSSAQEFYTRLRQQLAPARQVRDFLARHPAAAGWLSRWIGPLLAFGPLAPWLLGALALLACPPSLRGRIAPSLFLLTYLVHHVNRMLLEELAVWVFLHALRQGDYLRAARLPISPSRLGAEIEAAPSDLEFAFARFIACGLEGLEGLAMEPAALGYLVRVYLAAYGIAAAGPAVQARPRSLEDAPTYAAPSLIRRLLDRGVRFPLESASSPSLELEPLPRWPELLRGEGRERLAALYPGEPLWNVIGRRYEMPIRGLLLPLALLWPLLLGLAIRFSGTGLWLLPLLGAALSFGLLLWLTLLYANWICEESLRRRDFGFLARQLAGGKMRGELEDALGSRDPHVRERAIELLLFDDDIACLGITVPPAGLRKFLRRAS